MSEVNNKSNFLEGYLIWCFISGIFIISISMAIFTMSSVQTTTGWQRGYSMIIGAVVGIIATLLVSLGLEYKSR